MDAPPTNSPHGTPAGRHHAASGHQEPGGPAPTRSLSWPLILGLGLLALARPITNTVLDQLGADLGPVVPLGWTVLISVIWIGTVGLTRTCAPVVTLLLTGLVYGMAAIVLSGILSPILLGELTGPLTAPIGFVMVLVTNAVWGLITGVLALALQRVRGVGTGARPVSR